MPHGVRSRVAPVGLALAGLAAAVGAWTTAPAVPPPAGRAAWTASRVVGSPEPPPPYRAADAFPNLRFDHPVHITRLPGTDRHVVCQERGKLYSFPSRADVRRADLFFDPAAELTNLHLTPGATKFDRTYAVAFHPKFADNRTCFVGYTLRGAKGDLPDGTRISRFKVTADDPPRIDAASETIVLTFLQGGHNGLDLQFGPDGCLYVCLGDATAPNPPDALHTGQDITDLHSSVLRIDVDRHDPGLKYAVPKDNPFVGLTVRGKPARGEVWAYGFRNPFRMSFDRVTGDLWLGDVGWESWEMVHKVEKGGNYGWSVVEGRQAVHPDDPVGPTPIRPPVVELPHTKAASVTGGYVYRGKKFPELVGAYVFGDWETRRLWAARADGTRLRSLDELIPPTVRVVGFGEDEAGELYFLDHDTGVVHTLEKNAAAADTAAAFPRTLSATGLFASVRDETPAAGVYPFAVAAGMWQDHATARHWVALPGTAGVSDFGKKKRPIPGNVPWHSFQLHFPKDAVLARTAYLDLVHGDPSTRRPVETQLLHFDGSYWHGYSYAWRDDGSDADLVPADGAEKEFAVKDAAHAGGVRRQTWQFLGRSQCLQCHSPWTEYALGFNLPQLNRDADTPAGRKNQLDWLAEVGLLNRVAADDKPLPPYSPAERDKLPRLADPHDPQATTDDRARAYLHVNCSTCHRFGGGGSANIDLSAFAVRREMKDLYGPAKLGGFGLPDPKVIAPGEPERSVLLVRPAKFGGGRMPHIGSAHVDPAGVRLLADWIAGLDPRGDRPAADMTDAGIAQALESPASALRLAAAFHTARPDERARVLAAAAKLPAGPVRDLFDGYLPQDPAVRKLGPSPRPQTILARTGDTARGRELLKSQRVQCLSCHKLDGQGGEVGPDLSALAPQPREGLLESLLEPSRRVDAKYQAYLLRSADGRALSGLLVRKDAKEVVLRDAQGKDLRFDAEDVELFQPAKDSLMPAGLLADLTAQEAADLLAALGKK